ncbi:MAG TPA: hypothetical protein VFV58_03190 [Blastocatellia bacterium]|jgi:hypothetical protein|nr:hypothetical protein [Blastocatellia bacterium]
MEIALLTQYKRGAEFLLFLKKSEGKLSPYWDALSPTNEQLRSNTDPWISWVKNRLKTLQSGKGENKSQAQTQALDLKVITKVPSVHATFMPDTAWAISRLSPDLSRKLRNPSVLISPILFRHFISGSLAFVSLILT